MLLRCESNREASFPLVGTAFDYLLRFEIQRRAPHASIKGWVAEMAPDLIWQDIQVIESPDGQTVVGLDFDGDGEPKSGSSLQEVVGDEKEKAIRARKVLQNAKCAVSTYVTKKSPTNIEQLEIAAHAIRLAKLDSVIRTGRLDPFFEEISQEDIEDLADMLAIVPFHTLLHDKLLLLNPTFGKASALVGGADTDLIAGELLVDFKVTKEAKMEVEWLDQLLGYYFLVRHKRMDDPGFPEIKRLGLYFGRHGYLWERDVSAWTDHSDFLEIEKWFVSRAREVFGRRYPEIPVLRV